MIVKAYLTEITNKREYQKQDGTFGFAIEMKVTIPQQSQNGTVHNEEVLAERYFDDQAKYGQYQFGPTNDPTLYDVRLAFSVGKSKDGQRSFQRCRIQSVSVPC